MKYIICISLTLISTYSNAQTKKPSTTKAPKHEIDILCEKYKNTESITLFTPHGNLNGNVYVEFNDDEKPVSVSIEGNSENKAAISEFISNTIKMKFKQGYKATKVPFGWNIWTYAELVEQGLGFYFKEKNSFQLLMRKGNMYFRVDAGCCAKDSNGNRGDGYTWEIETGDTKRQGGQKAKSFEF